MDSKVLFGSMLAYFYNGLIGRLPSRSLRSAYLKLYLARFGRGTGVQMGCRFLNGRKIFLGDRNVINFDCLFDGRRYAIRTGNDVSIGPEAAILTLRRVYYRRPTSGRPFTCSWFCRRRRSPHSARRW